MGQGRLQYAGPAMLIDFLNLEPVIDLAPAASLVVNGTNADNAINYSQGSLPANGLVSVDGFETIEFSNKTTLTINALAGSDEINLNNPTTPLGLTSITVNGGDPTASDTVIVNGTTGNDAIVFAPTTNDDAMVTGAGPVPITLTTIEHTIINAQGGVGDALTYRSPANEDHIFYQPGAEFTSGSIAAVQDTVPVSPLMPLSFTNLGNVAVGLIFEDVSGGRVDDLFVAGTANDDVFFVSAAGLVSVRAASNGILVAPPLATPGVDHLTLQGLAGDDVFNVPGNHPYTDATAPAIAALVIEGGDPSASDVLNFTGSGAGNVTVNFEAQTVREAGFNLVSFTGVETLNVNANGQSVQVNGTAGDDLFDITPTGPDAVTVQNNGASPVVNATNVGATFTVNGAAGLNSLNFHGTASGDLINLSRNAAGPTLEVVGRQVVNALVSFVAWNVFAGDFSDIVSINEAGVGISDVQINIEAGAEFGDILNYNTAAANQTYRPGTASDGGTFDPGNGAQVVFAGIDTAIVNFSAPATGIVEAGSGANQVTATDIGASSVAVTVDNGTLVTFAGMLTALDLNAGAGDDVISITHTLFTGVGGIDVDGGLTDNDTLVVVTPANSTIGFTPAVNQGLVTVNALAPVNFRNTEAAVIDGVAGSSLTHLTRPGGDVVTFTPGASFDSGTIGTRQLGELVPLTFQHINASITFASGAPNMREDTLELNGTATADQFTINGPGDQVNIAAVLGADPFTVPLFTGGISALHARGLEGDDRFLATGPFPFTLSIDGGDPSASDSVTLMGATAAVSVNLGPTPTVAGYGNAVSLSGVELLIANAGGQNLTVSTTGADDVMSVTPTAGGGVLVDLISSALSNGSVPLVDALNIGTFTAALGGGSDHLIVNGTQAGETIVVTGALVAVGGLETVNYASVESLAVNGQAGNDTFNVTASTVTTFVDGGDPIGVVGDVLNLTVRPARGRPRSRPARRTMRAASASRPAALPR